jgi:putative membrane protein
MYNSTNLPLDRKKIIKKILENIAYLIIPIIPGALLIVLSVLVPDFRAWWLIAIGISLFILPVIAMYVYQVYYYKLYFYDFKEGSAEIKKGVISKSTGHVRYERIQNIFVDQDVLDRIFGLYDVHYETAGERSGSYSHVDGLNKDNSDKLVEFLNNQIYHVNNTTKQNIQKSLDTSKKNNFSVTGEIIDRNVIPISKKIIIQNIILFNFGSIFAILAIIMGFVGEDVDVSNSTIVLIFLIIISLEVIFSFIYNKIWFKNFQFQFSDNSGFIKTQVIALSNSYIYYDRIQNINVTQGILDRIFGLFSVTIETAAESSAKNKTGALRIPGLSKESAEKIKDFLLAKVEVYKNKL